MNNKTPTVTIVTGNPGKLKEIQELAKGRVAFRMQTLELTEIQSLDLRTIVEDKVRRAYAAVKRPVIVEDVSAGLDSLHGLPGPFIRFFNQVLSETALYQLAREPNEPVSITCLAAYYDGKTLLFGEGVVHGNVVAPRGTGGFGFDSVVQPTGEKRTLAEMSSEEKALISHRGLALRDLFGQLEQLTTLA